MIFTSKVMGGFRAEMSGDGKKSKRKKKKSADILAGKVRKQSKREKELKNVTAKKMRTHK